MKRYAMGIITIVFLVCASSMGFAGEKETTIPDLVGSWVCEERTGVMYEADTKKRDEIRITEQHGPYVRGLHIWGHPEEEKAVMHVGGKPTNKGEEPVVGVIDFDGKTLHLAEQGDWGHLIVRLADPRTMEVLYVESGPHAAVGRGLYIRR